MRLRQPRDGLRAAIDPVLLAAGIPARPGERVVEAGCGVGPAFLCLAVRVPGLHVTAVERDPGLGALARDNACANGVTATVLEADVADGPPASLLGAAEHAFANPPWWPDGTVPPDARRRAATHEAGPDLGAWARFLAATLRPGGTLSLLLPAARLHVGLAAVTAAGCGAPLVVPFWPRAGQPAKRILLRARSGRDGPLVLAPGLTLHDGPSGYSGPAEAVLRGGLAIAP